MLGYLQMQEFDRTLMTHSPPRSPYRKTNTTQCNAGPEFIPSCQTPLTPSAHLALYIALTNPSYLHYMTFAPTRKASSTNQETASSSSAHFHHQSLPFQSLGSPSLYMASVSYDLHRSLVPQVTSLRPCLAGLVSWSADVALM